MPTLRLLPLVALTAALLLPTAALSQDAELSPAPATEVESGLDSGDTRLTDLQAIMPEHLGGLPLREDAQLATGEQLSGQMADDERAVFEDVLEANDKTFSDYAGGNVFVPLSDTDVVVVQAHRVAGIDAAGTVDAWIEILGLNAERPRVVNEIIADKDVALFSDSAQPDLPLLHLFAAGDVMWMVVADDDSLVEEAVRTLSAASEPEPAAE